MRPFICVLAVIFLAAFFVAGCDSSSESEIYDLMLMDEDGAPVYGGTLQLRFEENAADGSQPVSGSWRLDPVGGSAPLAAAAGAVGGRRLESGIELGLDMNASDSGIVLDGSIGGGQIAGDWSAITIGGPMPQGTFEAEQR